MPTCPGCQQRVSYDRLDTHERYCHGIHGGETSDRKAVRRLEERVDEIERRLEGRVRVLEAQGGGRSLPDLDDDAAERLLEGEW